MKYGKDKIIISTKVGNDFYNAIISDDKYYSAIRQAYTKDYNISAIEESLKRT